MSRAAPQMRKLTTADALRTHAASLGVDLPVAEVVEPGPTGPLAQPLEVRLGDRRGSTATLANRFCILPMEGWDGTRDGRPTELVERRWRRFGQSGAALVWGGEAVAVRPEGRANPNQLCSTALPLADLVRLRELAQHGWRDRHGTTDGQLVGLQLTHSGRFARPDGEPAPRVAYRHPLLDARVGLAGPDGDAAVLSDAELDDLVDAFVAAAVMARDAGFAFVDVKACHGYLGHELLRAVDRPGPYGGDLDGRLRFHRLVVEGIRRDAPELGVAVRLSAIDALPFRPDADGVGRPEPWEGSYPYAFGGDSTGLGIDLTETHAVLDRLAAWGVALVCVSAGSPYYNPHVQRPAYFPPSDGYTPPEDPLVGVARQIAVTAQLAAAHPELCLVGSGYSYLQEWLGPVAQAVVAAGGAQAVGLGRMVLSYPTLPADLLDGRPLDTRHLCRTFSDCTTGPRNGVVSGCYPLDEHYKAMPERAQVAAAKKAMPGRPARVEAGDDEVRPMQVATLPYPRGPHRLGSWDG
jgi:2,4-dienoyl-CoA reductase-like NADH-dependent reductase (Old Yellow Enzyme family)